MEQYPESGFAWKVLGVSLQMQGKDALFVLQKATELLPADAGAHYNLGNALQELGRFDGAVASYRRAVEIKPDFAMAYSNQGNALQELGRFDEAVASYRRAVEINPDFAMAHSNLGNALQELGRLDEAVASYRRAVEIKPDFAEAHNNLGATLRDLGQLDGAVASCRRALEIKPDYAEAHSNLGAILQSLGQLDDAVASYRRSADIKPGYAITHNNMGNALRDLGRLDDAVVSYRRALKINPNDAAVLSSLGFALQSLGQLEGAVASYRRALEIKPDFAEALSNLGAALKDIGQLDAAEASYREALQIKPNYMEALGNLGNTLKDMGRPDEAEASYRGALQINPDYVEAHSNLGVTLMDMGRLDEAAASFRRALEIKPDYAKAHSNLLFCLSHSETADAQALFAEHRHFAGQFETPLRINWAQHPNLKTPDRCLQVGLVSGDLCDHAVAHFIEPVLAQLSNYPNLSLHAYYNNAIEDAVTQRLQKCLTHWHPIFGLSDVALAQKIREDGIDTLIDLSGHTAKHRLLTFARKPAPVQVSWIGYPGTTGLNAMDYYLADRFFLPPGQFESQFTEKIVRLPACAPFLPFIDAPPVNALPALSHGYMTFGSFNRTSKISRPAIALWSQLLRALPDARMVLGAMPQDGKNDTLTNWFAQEGITRERLSFHSKRQMKDYLELHNQVDICLDTFPYNGGTTTCHALWMGVPTLTMSGSTPASRDGATVLGHAGLEAFVARDAADFVQKGLYWAGNPAALSDIRAGLRERFAKSAMGQPAVVAAGLERALRIMWQRWCAGLPAESFEVSSQDVNCTMQRDNKSVYPFCELS